MSSKIKTSLARLCNVPNKERANEEYKENPLKVHREFIKKILARPINLKRVNIFTINYDCAFETAMDELGVMYIDGFIGSTKRFFKPEVYNYDFYFPATTTEGKVHRLDKVVHLYKLHGSLNWFESEQTPQNIYGITQKPMELISDLEDKRLIIYPQTMKEEETIGFPYSEMFRRFSSLVQQPQNALIVYGYGFGDKHVNRVLYNALSISTFQLIVVSWSWTANMKDFYEKVKDDSRVSFLVGNYLGDWYNFVFNILPDIKEMDVDIKVLETMKKIKGKDNKDGN
jgi:predicted RNA-binding protein